MQIAYKATILWLSSCGTILATIFYVLYSSPPCKRVIFWATDLSQNRKKLHNTYIHIYNGTNMLARQEWSNNSVLYTSLHPKISFTITKTLLWCASPQIRKFVMINPQIANAQISSASQSANRKSATQWLFITGAFSLSLLHARKWIHSWWRCDTVHTS